MHAHIPHPSPWPIAPHHNHGHLSSAKHPYGTRIRKNSVLRPSARLRHSSPPIPPPRRLRPVPTSPAQKQHEDPLPTFPLPNVVLHPEDASNKVFHAIGRSFLSVDNRAMTIKDLAEMALKFGLMCQNVSAASQAITTYIRNHLSRCDAQQDHPLLLRHVLSGTPADDELVPALYSRVGGATNVNKSNSKEGVVERKPAQPVNDAQDERLTNFRRGTMVWYLSKAAGVSCPFARAGIRLGEYGKEGKRQSIMTEDALASPNKSRWDQVRCGEKRKRLRRGCRQPSEDCNQKSSMEGSSPSPSVALYDTDSGDSDVEEEERPPKVKVTRRLRPSSAVLTGSPPSEVIDLSSESSSSEESDEDINMQLSSDTPWSLPPYPRRSIIIPSHTPMCDDSVRTCFPSANARRSPSVPCSASPPPDSDRGELDLSFDAETDFDWDSSSISVASPTIPLESIDGVESESIGGIKQEPQDVRVMLDLWEDVDCTPPNPSTVSSATVRLPPDDVKTDEFEFWEWEFESSWSGAAHLHEDMCSTDIKVDIGESRNLSAPFSLLGASYSPGPGFPVSPCSSLTASSSSFHSSVSPVSDVDTDSSSQWPMLPSPSLSPPYSSGFTSCSVARVSCADGSLAWQDTELLGPDSVHPDEFEEGWADFGKGSNGTCSRSARLHSKFSSRRTASTSAERENQIVRSTEAGPQSTAITDARPVPPSSRVMASDAVVVHTCQPCTPGIIATQVEGISVYQTTLGSTALLRRIDTDFVNLSVILSHLSLSVPSPLPLGCVSVFHRLSSVSGLWVPLGVARTYAQGLPDVVKDIFLSDELVMQFPSALQDFHKNSTPERMLNQFGPLFKSSAPNNSLSSAPVLEREQTRIDKEVTWEAPLDVVLEEPLVRIPPSFDVALAALRPEAPVEDETREMPLSQSEQEMFHALCGCPDWEDGKDIEEAGAKGSTESYGKEEKPLRRSRRVADAAAARSCASLRTRDPSHS
ncbi:hypothetical protein EDD17DRAFT_1542752 [Pisolithus thermaeus]|nr:hypothetical protein EDD17DRAFT_1542752 [Pisolithus thermaeus]